MEVVEETVNSRRRALLLVEFQVPISRCFRQAICRRRWYRHHGTKAGRRGIEEAHDELEQGFQERTAELAIFKEFAEASGLGFGMTGSGWTHRLRQFRLASPSWREPSRRCDWEAHLELLPQGILGATGHRSGACRTPKRALARRVLPLSPVTGGEFRRFIVFSQSETRAEISFNLEPWSRTSRNASGPKKPCG